MKILISGASGLIGSHLVPALETMGHQVFRLVRRPSKSSSEVAWEPTSPPDVNGFDAVIHLAGETIMGRWTADKKARIIESRVAGTSNLAIAAANATARPHTFIAASAIGYYGSCGDQVLTENSPPGRDFLSQVAGDWEAACRPAQQAGVRVVNLRIGVVLTPAGGALRQMLTPFRLGLGGKIGSGKQWMSWIALDDVISAILFALTNQSVTGPVNLVSPNPITNREFTKALGKVLNRPTLFPIPAAAIKLGLGEMGEALLLGSQRVMPAKLQERGYEFHHTEIAAALQSMLR